MGVSEEVQLKDLLPETYSLAAINVYNWGSFNRRHSAEIDQNGTAIIGPTGSGKTTVVDAFMTLICPKPKYNLASTGGHESDRDLMSYVRGVSGAGKDGSTDHISRPLKTVTAVEACFENGEKPVNIAAILWVDSSSNAMTDLKRAWIFCENKKYGIDEFLEIHKEGGMRALKQLGRDVTGVQVSDSKNTYLAHLRRFFEVGDNAFTLLNRAAGLKQINSIDDLFRDLVLDDCSAFTRASEVASEFDDLATIHAELETARLQQGSLQPIATEYEKLNKSLDVLEGLNKLNKILPVWYSVHAYALWGDKEKELSEQKVGIEEQFKHIDSEIKKSEDYVESLRDIYMKRGGSNIEHIEKQIQDKEERLVRCETKAATYIAIAGALGFEIEVSNESFVSNKTQAVTLENKYKPDLELKKEQMFTHGAERKNCNDRVEELKKELGKITGKKSNIPSKYLDFQDELSQQLGLDVSSLPFIAELIEVKAEEASWRGAIERAIGAQRLRLLVPSKLMRQALSWVNNRNNRVNVKLLQVEDEYSRASFFEDGYTRKINFKGHLYREAVKHLLAGIDRHCVAGPDELKKTPRGMTPQGLMSGKAGYFDKQDASRLDQNWMTGFDNKDRMAMITKALKVADNAFKASERKVEAKKSECSQLEHSLKLIDRLNTMDYVDIDTPGLTAERDNLKEQLAATVDPGSDIGLAKKNWENEKYQLTGLRTKQVKCQSELAVLENGIEDAKNNKASAYSAIGEGLKDEEITLGDSSFKKPGIKNVVVYEREESKRIQKELGTCAESITSSKVLLAKLMTEAKKYDTGALTEAGTESEDVAQYLEQLRILNEEALPEKQARFIEYLTQSSDQGVNQLLMGIESEVEKINHRIDDLNHTMRRVDFQPGRYLRLEPRKVVHESLNTLKKSQAHLRYAATLDDQGESHYKALQAIIEQLRDAAERKRTKAAQSLLDPRYRLQFSVSVVDRNTAETIETRTGSQGGSGGEKEIIASYILTASLSYALCPDGSPTPLFGTVILDEAFSRSSQAVAGRIIAALRAFGLHPLFITPNKEIKLLRSHTRSAVLIHNKGMNATMTSLSWEELEEQANKSRT